MKTYFKSLLPIRWIIIAVLIFLTTVLLWCCDSMGNDLIPNYYYVINFIYWFIIDFSFGLGRELEEGIGKILFGVGVTIIITLELVMKLYNLGFLL